MHRWLIRAVLALCALALPAVASEDFYYHFIGRSLTAEQVASLEEQLEANTGDLSARTVLIYYYFGRFADEDAQRARHDHVLWLIRNAPEAGVLGRVEARIEPYSDADSYVAGKDAWLRHIEREPTNVTLLSHAENFLSNRQDRGLVLDYLQKLQSLEPDNPQRRYDLGFFYWLEARGAEPDIKKAKALQALEQFQGAWALSREESAPMYWLTYLGKAAMAAERYDDARTYATAMLEHGDHDDYGDFSHHGNLVLGMLALIEGHIEQARYYLLQAGRLPESVGRLQPSMDLALQLLRQGESEVVIEYLELCSEFWPEDELNDWAAMVRGGGIPHFSMHLHY